MAITAVGTPLTNFSLTGTSINKAYTPAAVNNLLIVTVVTGVGNATSASISDTQSVSWITFNPFLALSTNQISAKSWVGLTTNTNSDTITVSVAGTGANPAIGITIEEFSGTATSTIVDQVNHTADGQQGSFTTPSITLTNNNELVWSFCAGTAPTAGNIDGSAATAGADDGNGDKTEYRILSGRGGAAVTASWTDTAGATHLGFIGSINPFVAPPDAQEWLPRVASMRGPNTFNVMY